MFKADDYRLRLKSLSETLAEAKYALDIDNIGEKLKELKAEQEKPEVWNDLEKSKQIGREISVIEGKIASYQKGENALKDAQAFVDLIEEADDESLVPELEGMIKSAEDDIEEMRIKALLKGKYDANNAILSLHAGAGGTEACDWTQMLYRMYQRYCEKSGFKVTELDREDGDEAGIKSVSFKIDGENAYGFLKAEKGVHRLVRISPFDSNARRHTSFVSVDIFPVLDDDIDIEIDEKDLRIDTYRSSGAGGQHVNTTDSAVRITHIPTGTVVCCQNERSQHKNRATAMNMLKAKLYQLEEEKRRNEADILRGEKTEMGWGNQIRSYVLQPYQMVKDLRTGEETGNTAAVLDGEIDRFIEAYLKAVSK